MPLCPEPAAERFTVPTILAAALAAGACRAARPRRLLLDIESLCTSSKPFDPVVVQVASEVLPGVQGLGVGRLHRS